jgi:protein SCO1/2
MLGALGAAPVVGGLGAWATRRATGDGEHESARERIQRLHLPDVPLVTAQGLAVHFYSDLVEDKKVLINFIFTSCTEQCPLATANLATVQRMLGAPVGRDIFMYTITLDPVVDTPAVLAEFASRYDVGPGWSFLTGKPADIDRLRRALGFTYQNAEEDADKTNHLGMLRHGDEPAMRWAGTPVLGNPRHIVRGLRWDLMDAPSEAW